MTSLNRQADIYDPKTLAAMDQAKADAHSGATDIKSVLNSRTFNRS